MDQKIPEILTQRSLLKSHYDYLSGMKNFVMILNFSSNMLKKCIQPFSRIINTGLFKIFKHLLRIFNHLINFQLFIFLQILYLTQMRIENSIRRLIC